MVHMNRHDGTHSKGFMEETFNPFVDGKGGLEAQGNIHSRQPECFCILVEVAMVRFC